MNIDHFIETFPLTEGEAVKYCLLLVISGVGLISVASVVHGNGWGFCRYNLFCIPSFLYKTLIDFIFGKKYLVKINDTWTVARGRRRRALEQLFVFYGRDNHEWLLEKGEWMSIDKTWDERQIQEVVVEKNILDLRIKNPMKDKFDDNGPLHRRYGLAQRDLSRLMRLITDDEDV